MISFLIVDFLMNIINMYIVLLSLILDFSGHVAEYYAKESQYGY